MDNATVQTFTDPDIPSTRTKKIDIINWLIKKDSAKYTTDFLNKLLKCQLLELVNYESPKEYVIDKMIISG